MFKKIILVSGLSTALLAASGTSFAAEQDRDQMRDQDKLQTQDRDQVYGSSLMTNQERAEYRSKMQAANSAEERMRIRKENHKQMQVSAKKRGIKRHDEPPAMHQRQNGMGNGMGSGGKCGGGGMGGGKR